VLRLQLTKRGFDKAMDVLQEERQKDPTFQPAEHELNDWGYRVMSSGHNKDALEIFNLNVVLYPNSWNAYDSYGESLAKDGLKEEAIKMYRKSVELNPRNEGGKKALERLMK
jgi:tetratricopeptide (TPR) repeat protein